MRRDISTCVTYLPVYKELYPLLIAVRFASQSSRVESSRAATYLMTRVRPTNRRTFAEKKERDREKKMDNQR